MAATIQVEDPSCWTSNLELRGILIHVLTTKPLGRLTMREVLEVSGTDAGCESLLLHLRRTPTVADFSFARSGPSDMFGVVDSQGCSACRILQASGAAALECACAGSSAMRWSLVCPGRSTLERLITDLGSRGLRTTVDRIGKAAHVGAMTPRQREVLRVAMDLGYFSAPRQAGLADIAERFGVSKTAVSRILRKAERNGLSMLDK